ncbi:hypothetical protein JD844_034038 [Phrynosoma platyrhinos]|uniref:Amyloid beta A4 protein-binding family A member 3 n=1 Tax=Phrynosoma platyrhinos TaxID=52577 RepID=A0ABQ7T8N1_PHRPL|nr:hypothetical protein JD844_034038 [Phrynosoma platyrhinos]
MDFKTEAISGTDVPTELLEPPPMDLEETPGPQDPTEDLPPIRQQPSPASGSLEVTLTPPNMEPCNPGMTEIQSSQGEVHSPEWLLDPQDSSPQVYTEVGLEGLRNAMEEGVTEPPEEKRSWVMDRGLDAEVGNGPQAPSNIDQSDPLMELEEREEDIVAEDVPEVDQIQLQGLVTQLKRLSPSFHDSSLTSEDGLLPASDGEESAAIEGGNEEKAHLLKCRGPPGECGPCPLHIATGHGLGAASRWPPQLIRGSRKSRGLLSAETNREDLLSLLCYEGGIPSELDDQTPLAHSDVVAESGGQRLKTEGRAEMSLGPLEEAKRKEPCQWEPREGAGQEEETSLDCGVGPSQKGEPSPDSAGSISPEVSVPGPCEPEDLLEGVIFGAKYLGSTQLVSERNPPTSVRMAQAQEAMDRIKEAMMDHPLQTISYIADIGNIVVLMARRKLPRRANTSIEKRLYKMICHVFYSADLIAQAIGQAFSVAYQHFLRASGIDPSQLSPRQPDHEEDDDDDDDDTLAKGEELYNGDLAHFSKQENCKKICSLMRGGIAERGGIRVGHRIIEINGQSVVAMPHEKIIQILTQAVSEVHIKTMPASTYRLLTGQEQPVFL